MVSSSARLIGTLPNSPSTKRIVSANGATISGRNIASLRNCAKQLPDVPIMALTATATERVRVDIVEAIRIARPARLRGQL